MYCGSAGIMYCGSARLATEHVIQLGMGLGSR